MRSVMMMFAAISFAAPLSAQQVEPSGFSLGLGAGLASGPASPFSSKTKGYYLQSALEFPSPTRFLRLRTDALFADWGAHTVKALTANAVFTALPGRNVQPYVLVGAGGYISEGPMKSGWTMGAGLRLPSQLRAITIETRMHAFLSGAHSDYPVVQLCQTGCLVNTTEDKWRYVWTPIGLGIQF